MVGANIDIHKSRAYRDSLNDLGQGPGGLSSAQQAALDAAIDRVRKFQPKDGVNVFKNQFLEAYVDNVKIDDDERIFAYWFWKWMKKPNDIFLMEVQDTDYTAEEIASIAQRASRYAK